MKAATNTQAGSEFDSAKVVHDEARVKRADACFILHNEINCAISTAVQDIMRGVDIPSTLAILKDKIKRATMEATK